MTTFGTGALRRLHQQQAAPEARSRGAWLTAPSEAQPGGDWRVADKGTSRAVAAGLGNHKKKKTNVAESALFEQPRPRARGGGGEREGGLFQSEESPPHFFIHTTDHWRAPPESEPGVRFPGNGARTRMRDCPRAAVMLSL